MAVSFDRVADRYDETRGGMKRGREFASDIRPWLSPGSVLEVAVGTGVVASALIEPGTTVLGVDISRAMASRALARLGPRVVLGDARALPVRAASVDNVLFAMALHLVGDVPAAMAEAARVLRPGGRVVAVHGPPDARPTDLVDAMRSLDGMRNLRVDDTDTLAAAATAAGLDVVHQGWTRWYQVPQSPNEVADTIEDRVWSYLWRLDEAGWLAEAEPAIAALRALPEPDRARPAAQRQRLSVFGAAGGALAAG
jgi:SAM-dependent methyltransferase